MINYHPLLANVTILSIIIRIILALLLGGILGIERGRKNQAAGFRTYMLVCLGATMVMITSQYMHERFGTGDPSRMGAQVINGIGFLGAGSIIITGSNKIRGLTTAAGLWTSACIGLAIGIGFYEGAILAGLTVLFIMTSLQKIEMKVLATNPLMTIYAEFLSVDKVGNFIEYCRSHNIQIVDTNTSKSKIPYEESVAVTITIRNPGRMDHATTIQEFSRIDGLNYIEEV